MIFSRSFGTATARLANSCAADAAAAEHLVELLLVGGVISHRGGRIL